MEMPQVQSRGFNTKSRSFVNQIILCWKQCIHWRTLAEPATPRLPTSRIRELSCSNELPTDAEAVLILDVISKYEAKAQLLRTNLTAKGAFGTILRASGLTQFRLNKVNDTIARHKRLLSPIRRIPPEILEMIFAYSLSNYEDGNLDDDYGLTTLPLSQSRVSKFWRDVSSSSSKLWTQIPTIYLDRPYSTTPCFLTFLKDVLERRSGNIPVNFHITYRGSLPLNLHPAVALLVRHSAKWKTARLDIFDIQLCDLSKIKGRLPLLEKLVLTVRWCGHDRPLPPDIIDTFQVAPRLREVIYRYAFGTEFPSFLIPHSQLRSYCNFATYTQQGFECFSRFTLLQTLELGPRFQPLEWSSGQVVTLLNLTTLKLEASGNDSTYARRVLGVLNLPGLKNLSICVDDSGSRTPDHSSILQSTIDLILRSEYPPLKKLRMKARFADEPQGGLSEFLQSTPHVTHLEVCLPHIDDLKLLVRTEDPVAPLLQVCTFLMTKELSNDEANLCRELVLHRREMWTPSFPLSRLRTLNIHFLCFSASWEPYDSVFNTQISLLNEWAENTVSVHLKECKVSIEQHLLTREQARQARLMIDARDLPKNFPSSVIISDLSSILELEVTQANDIYASAILPTLRRLANTPASFERYLTYRHYSKLILKKWQPLLSRSLPDDFRWVERSEHEVSYVPSDCPSRRLTMDRRTYFRIPIPEIPESDRAW